MGEAAAAASPPSRLELVRVRAPLVREHRAAGHAQSHRESVLVGWHPVDGGATGWGECPTLDGDGYVTEPTEVAWRALVGHLGPAAMSGAVATGVVAPAATAALADARLDAALRAGGESLADHVAARVGRPARPAVPRCAVVAMVGASPAEVATAAVAEVAAGAAMVKVKVGAGAGSLDVLRAVVDRVEVPVAADANGSLDADDAVALDGLGLAYLEQPLAAGTPWADLARLRERLVTPVALDESLPSPDAVRDALRAGALDAVSVKPARLGGCRAAAAVLALGADLGVDCFVGGMFELGIGRAAAAAVASSSACTLPTDLGPSQRYVRREICEPLVTDAEGRLVVPEGPGIGRTPDPAALDVVDRVVLGT